MSEQRNPDRTEHAGQPTRRTRRGFLAAAGTVGAAALAGCTGDGGDGGGDGGDGGDGGGGGGGASGTMTIFHAGSLESPFSDVETAFEEQTDVSVNREAKGSVGSMQKITEQGRKADVLGVSDFRLIRDNMLTEFASWYGIFTTNAMTIAYTEDSTGASEFGTDNWWEVLARDDVTFGHSDPAVDPNGYRSVMAMKLGAIPFEGETQFSESTSETLIDKARIPSGTETELVGQVQSGELDYAWQYTSAGASKDVQVVDLQPEVNLAKATQAYAEHYAKAEVQAGGNTYTGAPIAYGVTVPKNAPNPAAGAAWCEFISSEEGRGILEENGLSPVSPMVVPERRQDSVPADVMANAEAKASLGPLDL
jgi:molybdate/tungstate transport system substrate-binding protein